MDKDKYLFFGTIPLAATFSCRKEVLGEGFHTEIAGVAIKIGMPEAPVNEDSGLEPPRIWRGYGDHIRWGSVSDGIAYVHTLFFGFHGTAEDSERIRKEIINWSTRLQNLYMIRSFPVEAVSFEERSEREVQVYQMNPDGSAALQYHVPERSLREFLPEAKPYGKNEIQNLIEDAGTERNIPQCYAVLLSACHAWLNGDDYTAVISASTALELAAEQHIAQHEEEAEKYRYGIVLGEGRDAHPEMLARLGVKIPEDCENRIISICSSLKYGHAVPTHEAIRTLLEDCRSVMELCVPVSRL